MQTGFEVCIMIEGLIGNSGEMQGTFFRLILVQKVETEKLTHQPNNWNPFDGTGVDFYPVH